MDAKEYVFLLADRNSLIHLIETLPVESLIARMSFEARLKDVEAEIRQYELRNLPRNREVSKQISGAKMKKFEEEKTGELIGILPADRRFNFREKGSKEIISGGFSRDMTANVYRLELMSYFNLFKPIKVYFYVKQAEDGTKQYKIWNYKLLEE
jgi:hypothetical protein